MAYTDCDGDMIKHLFPLKFLSENTFHNFQENSLLRNYELNLKSKWVVTEIPALMDDLGLEGKMHLKREFPLKH